MINISNEDCMKLMKRYDDNHFDLAIVDPPYGIGKDGLKWDQSIPNQKYFNQLFRVSKKQIIFGGNYFNLRHSQGWLCWDKYFAEDVRGVKLVSIKRENVSDFELIWTSFLKKSKLIRYTFTGNLSGFNNKLKVDYNYKGSIHPTQKPVALYKWLLRNYAKPDDKILDTHLGSGSIAIACHDMKFNLTGCELDTEYYNAAMKRLKNHQAQLQIF